MRPALLERPVADQPERIPLGGFIVLGFYIVENNERFTPAAKDVQSLRLTKLYPAFCIGFDRRLELDQRLRRAAQLEKRVAAVGVVSPTMGIIDLVLDSVEKFEGFSGLTFLIAASSFFQFGFNGNRDVFLSVFGATRSDENHAQASDQDDEPAFHADMITRLATLMPNCIGTIFVLTLCHMEPGIRGRVILT